MASDKVKDHSDSERGNPPLSLHGLLFPISSKDSFNVYAPLHRQGSTYHGLFYTGTKPSQAEGLCSRCFFKLLLLFVVVGLIKSLPKHPTHDNNIKYL